MAESWLIYHCQVREADVVQVEACLAAAGAQAVTCTAAENDSLVVDELDARQPLWSVCEVTGLFDSAADLAGLEGLIKGLGIVPLQVRTSSLQDQNWQESWRDQFKPQQYGQRLWVCPTWCDPPSDKDLVVRLDPGMAFGTGNHATTSMCLEWLSQSEALPQARVLDFGCGSGILAFAAAKLGASEVTAVDIDPLALKVCGDNAIINGLQNITLAQPHELQDLRYDIIVANILLEPLTMLVQRFAELLVPGGSIVISGILQEQCPQLLATYSDAFNIDTRRQADEWALLSGVRNDR